MLTLRQGSRIRGIRKLKENSVLIGRNMKIPLRFSCLVGAINKICWCCFWVAINNSLFTRLSVYRLSVCVSLNPALLFFIEPCTFVFIYEGAPSN